MVACEGSDLNINCASGETIDIKHAHYGRGSREVCTSAYSYPQWDRTTCIGANSEDRIRAE